MCGICGELQFEHASWQDHNIQQRLIPLMARRGPDDEGFWSDQATCSLGFRRLAILDLSPAGHQPMWTPEGRYVMVFNGELYNFPELKRELEQMGTVFRSSGDAEVVLQALAHWGTATLKRFNGMFALAFYDCQERRLLLARDHAGIKPLYFLRHNNGLVFASQYNQLLAHPWSRDLSVSQQALAIYLRLGYIPAPNAILTQTHMLQPGSWLQIGADGRLEHGTFFEFPKYQIPDLTGPEANEAVNEAVSRAVKRQLISDVPVGAFLSGGIDSPLIAAKMQAIHSDPISAFTIGTQGSEHDESTDAVAYAQDLGVNHHLAQITPNKAIELLDDVVTASGEPFADYSLFPTMLVSQFARQHVTVMLSGDGGDELFWGYVGRLGSVISQAGDFRQKQWLRNLRWSAKRSLGVGDAHWSIRLPTIGHWYRGRHSHLADRWIARIFPGQLGWPQDCHLFDYAGWQPDQTAQWLRWNEFVGHLTMVLLKVDRASMHHSLEVRVPLLDKEVIEIACRIDWRSCLNIAEGMGKLPLRHALARHTVKQTSNKRGFTVPMAEWLRTSLKPVFTELVIGQQELVGLPINRQSLQDMYGKHLSGQADYSWGLWILLSLALWHEKHFQNR